MCHVLVVICVKGCRTSRETIARPRGISRGRCGSGLQKTVFPFCLDMTKHSTRPSFFTIMIAHLLTFTLNAGEPVVAFDSPRVE